METGQGLPIRAGHRATGVITTEILERDRALDGVRGLAIALVIVGHAFSPQGAGLLHSAMRAVFGSGFIGVDLFFVLSGFLITSILLRTRSSAGYLRNFYARRVLRIFPAYYFVLAMALLAGPALLAGFPDAGQVREDAPYFVLYLQNLVMAWRGGPLLWPGLSPTWSLAIEEQFYLAWPLVVLLVPARHLIKACLALAAGSVALKVALALSGASWWTYCTLTFSHLEGLAAGAAVAAWVSANPSAAVPAGMRLAGSAAGLSLLTEIVAHQLGLISNNAHLVLVVVLCVPFFAWLVLRIAAAGAGSRLRRVFETRPLIFLGKYSYGIYLIHGIVITHLFATIAGLPRLHGFTAALAGLGGCALSVLLAVLMYHAIEQPMLRLKRYFVPRRATARRAPIARQALKDSPQGII